MGKEKKQIKNHRGKVAFLLLLAVIGVLAVVQILVANRLATQGDLIKKYETEAYWLDEENQKIENEIVKLSSLSHLASESARLAFKKETPVLYLPKPVVVATEWKFGRLTP